MDRSKFKKSIYRTWSNMLQRCTNPKNPGYARYGGRGIGVYPAWRSFAAFERDVGPKPSARHTLDRVDNDGNYEPGNVRWTCWRTQATNRRTSRSVSGVQPSGKKKWAAYIRVSGRKTYIGTFNTEAEAHKAYAAASQANPLIPKEAT